MEKISHLYGSVFHQNETLSLHKDGIAVKVFGPTEHTPVIKGTLTGHVCYNDEPIKTFVFSSAGACTSTKIGKPNNFVQKMEINWQTGCITTIWNGTSGDGNIKLIVSYECER